MPTFPRLKTAAVTQYPATRRLRYQNQKLRFLDGTEQRYRDCASPLRRWDIALRQLDETELAALEEFFAENQGMMGSFSFTDPQDGQTYDNCSLERDDMELTWLGEMDGTTTLTITQSRD